MLRTSARQIALMLFGILQSALFPFLAGTAGTRIIAADLRGVYLLAGM